MEPGNSQHSAYAAESSTDDLETMNSILMDGTRIAMCETIRMQFHKNNRYDLLKEESRRARQLHEELKVAAIHSKVIIEYRAEWLGEK